MPSLLGPMGICSDPEMVRLEGEVGRLRLGDLSSSVGASAPVVEAPVGAGDYDSG